MALHLGIHSHVCICSQDSMLVDKEQITHAVEEPFVYTIWSISIANMTKIILFTLTG